MKTALVERTFTLGGAATQSLVGPLQTYHSPRGRIVGGFAHEIIDRLRSLGASPGYVRDPIGFAGSLAPVDSEVMKLEIFTALKEKGVTIIFGEAISSATLDDGAIKAVTTASGMSLTAGAFIDASGNGDLTHKAGAPMEYDKDAQPMSLIFKMRGVRGEEVVRSEKENPENFVLHPDPATLDRPYYAACGYFAEVRKATRAGRFPIPRDRILFFMTCRSDEVVVNTTRVTGNALEPWALSRAWQEGLVQMEALISFLRSDIPGFKDAYLSQLPERLGVRETRRMEGLHMLREYEIIRGETFPDTIARGAFPLDIHSATGSGLESHILEGFGDYGIPLRSVLNGAVKNLVTVGRCMSVTHKGFSSTRVMPTSMAVG
jgi:hypothetical protein